MRTLFLILMLVMLGSGCQGEPALSSLGNPVDLRLELPAKDDALNFQSSPIQPHNIDEYMHREEIFYVDVRSPNQWIDEGFIAGFTNLPFYGFFVKTQQDDFGLFRIERQRTDDGHIVAAYGQVGSFIPLYEESSAILNHLFPRERVLFALSSAGVESQYLLSLLVQHGYEPERLYNVGNFSNSLGTHIAYRLRTDARYLVAGHSGFEVSWLYDLGALTPIDD